MNKNISIALLALLAFTGVTASAQTTDGATSVNTANTTTGTVCTTEAKICPDGTAVGRTGPNCEFALCAKMTNTTTGTAGTVGLPPKPLLTPEQKARIEAEARERALRAGVTVPKQTQGATFGDRARLGATTTSAIKDMRGEIKGSREEMEKRAKEMRGEIEKKRGEIKDEQMKKRLEQARKQTELVNKRLEQAIERVQKLSDRVAERLTKLEAEGVTTTVSRGHLAEAKTKLDEARTKAAGVKLAIETAFANLTLNTSATTTPGASPKNVMKEVQEAVKETAKVIQEAHKHVALAISTVKPGLNKPRPATTTPTTVPATTSATTTQ